MLVWPSLSKIVCDFIKTKKTKTVTLVKWQLEMVGVFYSHYYCTSV